jgi:two-component system, OmpR family, response regulator AdeR
MPTPNEAKHEPAAQQAGTDPARKLVLVVEDESTISRIVVSYLEREGYRTEVARDGLQASQFVHTVKPDLVILDVMLPGRSGLDVLRRLREESDTPVILLTARTEEIDRILGFELGADDYVTKPFSARELMARVNAVLRRRSDKPTERPHPPLRLSGLELHPDRMTVAYEGRPIEVTTTEFRLLACLLDQPGRVFSRAHLLEAALPESEALERVVDSHFRNLRKKLPPAIRIEPVRGVGYRVTVDADR